MFLASIFLAALARSLAAPTSPNIPNSAIPSPVCVVSAALTSSKCEPSRIRSLYDIVWSCVGTILLCTYISIHHNIPDRNHSWARVMSIKVRTTLYALLAPELVIMWAMRQKIMAGKITEMNKGRGWTNTHGFFVQMGGLMVEVEKGRRYEVVGWSTKQSIFIRGTNSSSTSYDPSEIVQKIPTINEAEIRDHGKGDFLSKTIVVLQTTWFVFQCIARRYENLELTELELITLAFAVLNVITYILWWDKPLNVCYPIYFDLDGKRVDGPSGFMDPGRWRMDWYGGIALSWSVENQSMDPTIWERVMEELVGNINDIFDVIFRILWFLIPGPFYYSYKAFIVAFSPLLNMTDVGDPESRTSVSSFDAAWMEDKDHVQAIVYSCLIGVTFGGIHLIGWNFTFATTTELWLWRSSSIILTVAPLFMALWQLSYYVFMRTGGFLSGMFEFFQNLFLRLTIFVAAPVYIGARIIIVLLAILALRNLSDSAYQNVPWTDIIPHL